MMVQPFKTTSENTLTPLEKLQREIAYEFKNNELLIQSLTHKSYVNEKPKENLENNERLEFLGDAVLQFVISDILMSDFPHLTEGELSKFRAVLVSEIGLTSIANQIQLGKFLFIGKGEENTGGRRKKSILSDALEALLAAIFLDSKTTNGYQKVYTVIHTLFEEEIGRAEKTFTSIDYKTNLQEFTQKLKLGRIQYDLLSETGPDHNKEFVTAVVIESESYGTGTGKSKKIAEQIAATAALKKLKEIYGD